MKILKIVKLKNNKYKIKLENEIVITYADIIINNNILYKSEIDNELYKKIIKETAYFDNYNKVLKFTIKKVRCSNELKKYIESLKLDKQEEIKILKKILKLNLVNDKTYVESYINDKLLFSKDSINKIKKDLINKEIDLDIIEDVLKDINFDQKDKLVNIIRKKIKTNHKYSNYILKNKIINEMMSLGYEKDIIENVFEDNKINDYDIMLKEYQKIYNKLYKKYDNQQLEFKIKSMLYSKGFNYEDIKKEDII